ncbi:MAG: nucleotidyl transferase AbiEii/AbiGii toxin family protein [Deltaproteobacteria bacterium]|nr:nucleotidyl transferase AbiEii/AbiGii toxin family protein [Deltaproteobacteria bacterium]
MRDQERHEEFEMLTLEQMRKVKVLDQLIFGGGTMLRLCFDLPRYSMDFDFYLKKERRDFLPWVDKLSQAYREMGATITDQWEKHYSFLWEIRSPSYPRRLKIEIRKVPDQSGKTELGIAHSHHSPFQVRLRILTLEQMWQNKVSALVERREIRDAYDLEFLSLRKAGNFKTLKETQITQLAKVLDSFSEQDFRSTLGAILEKEERERVLDSRFSYLRSQIQASLPV